MYTSERLHMNSINTRKMAAYLGLCLVYSAFGCEWTWLIEIPGILYLSAHFMLLPVVLFVCHYLKAFDVFLSDVKLAKTSIWLALFFLSIIVLERIHVSAFDSSIGLDFYIGLVQALLFGVIGYYYGRDGRDILWILGGTALILSGVSVYSFLAGNTEPKMTFPTLAVGFPMAYFVLFGFYWYLHAWLASSGVAVRPLLGLIACSFYVIFSFMKPVIIPAMGGIVFLLLFSVVFNKRNGVYLTRLFVFTCIAAIIFFSIDVFSGNKISDAMVDKIIYAFLHLDFNQENISLTQLVNYIFLHDIDLLELASGGRYDLWAAAEERIRASPLIGSGFGQTSSVLSGVDGSVPFHNGYLDLLLSVGIAGCIPVLIGIVLWFRSMLSRVAINRTNGLLIPVVSYVVSIMVLNYGGTSRLFPTLSAFIMFLVGLSTGWVRNGGFR